MQLETRITAGWDEYTLLDSGAGRKLERLAGLIIDRPEPQALWAQQRPDLWAQADAVFTAGGSEEDESTHGRWLQYNQAPDAWQTQYQGLKFRGWLTNFRHVGYFPEQVAHWEWLQQQIKPQMKLLNLFAYSGVHSLIAAQAGATVTHVDASKKAITWAKENQALNNVNWPIRWIVDDALKFVQREIRRGNRYEGIVLDPPKFGRGPDNEVWDLFTHLPELLAGCATLLAPEKGSFLLMTSYALRASAMSFGQAVQEYLPQATVTCGELFVREEKTERLLPTSMFTRAVR